MYTDFLQTAQNIERRGRTIRMDFRKYQHARLVQHERLRVNQTSLLFRRAIYWFMQYV